jgi:hypothetical protein
MTSLVETYLKAGLLLYNTVLNFHEAGGDRLARTGLSECEAASEFITLTL